MQFAGGNAPFRVALRGGAEVLCGKNTMIQKGLQSGHNDCPNAELDKLRAYLKGNLGFITATNCSTGRYSRGAGKQQALARSKSRTNLQCRFEVAFRTDRNGSIADQFLPVAQYWTEDGWSWRLRDCVGSRHRCSRGLSVGLHFSVMFQEADTHHLALLSGTQQNRSRTSCVLTSVPRVMFPATLRSTLVKESWGLPTGARWSESRRAAWRWPFLLDKVTESTCLHLDQLCPWIRQPFWHTGAKLWTKALFWTKLV